MISPKCMQIFSWNTPLIVQVGINVEGVQKMQNYYSNHSKKYHLGFKFNFRQINMHTIVFLFIYPIWINVNVMKSINVEGGIFFVEGGIFQNW